MQTCLRIRNEEVLILGDVGYDGNPLAPIVTASYYLAAQEMGFKVGLIVQEPKIRGDDADEEIVKELKNLGKGKVLIMALSSRLRKLDDLGSFRTYIKENDHRFVSSTSLGGLVLEDLPALIKAIDIDYDALKKKGQLLKEKMDKGEKIRITTPAGTDITMNIKGKIAINNCGDYAKPGKGGNIPAGEVYIPPKWKHVEGKAVIDGSCAYRLGTQIIKEPITLTIEKDEVVKIEGGKEADLLRETLDWATKKSKFPWGVRRIGELGIGTNPGSVITGSTVIDEKTYGTAHIAIGSNYWFGGTIYAIIHLDQIFKDPKIEIDGEEIEV